MGILSVLWLPMLLLISVGVLFLWVVRQFVVNGGRHVVPVISVVGALVAAFILFNKDYAEATMDPQTHRKIALACASERIGHLFFSAVAGDTRYGPLEFAEECRPTWFRAFRNRLGPHSSTSQPASGSSGCVGCLSLDEADSTTKTKSAQAHIAPSSEDSMSLNGQAALSRERADPRQRFDSLEGLLATTYNRVRADGRARSYDAGLTIRNDQRQWLGARDSACGHPSIATGFAELTEDSIIMCFVSWDSSRIATLDSMSFR
jgi:hypothetical protein